MDKFRSERHMTVTDETVIEVGDANDESEKSLFTGYEIEITNITINIIVFYANAWMICIQSWNFYAERQRVVTTMICWPPYGLFMD